MEIENPFKKKNVNGYNTYSPDNALKTFLKSFNPLIYSNLVDKSSWNITKAFLLGILIASLLFIILVIPKINSLDFSEQLDSFDELNITMENKMNSALELPEQRPYLIIDTREKIEDNISDKKDITNYNITLFETNQTQEAIAETKEKLKENINNMNSRIFIDNNKIAINTLFVKKEINFEDYKNILENQENYKTLFIILFVVLIPSIILLFSLYLLFKFIIILLIAAIITIIVCLIAKFKIKSSYVLKIGLLAAIPTMIFEAISLSSFFNIWQIYYLIYPIFAIYFVLGVLRKGYKEKQSIF